MEDIYGTQPTNHREKTACYFCASCVGGFVCAHHVNHRRAYIQQQSVYICTKIQTSQFHSARRALTRCVSERAERGNGLTHSVVLLYHTTMFVNGGGALSVYAPKSKVCDYLVSTSKVADPVLHVVYTLVH